MELVENSVFGLAWYSNTTTAKPYPDIKHLNINDLYIEGIDYLQVFGTGTKKRKSKRFKVSDLNIATRLYKKSYVVTDEVLNIKVCVMNCEPASPVLPEGSVSIKFDNELLYMEIFRYKYIKAFFNAVGFEMKYISRLDIYRDFQRFRPFMPEDLIRSFMREEYLCLSRAKFDVIGVNNAGGLSYQYLRNGKKSSGRQFYLYNKSLELKEVGNKEHVVQTWYKANFNNWVDVWRLELSLTRGKRNVVLDEGTGELESVDLRDIFKKGFLNKVYDGGLRSSFTFVKNEGKRKTRSKRIKLFSKRKVNIRLSFGSAQVDKLRMRKIIAGALIRDMMREVETREHRSRSINEQIESVIGYCEDNNMSEHLKRVIYKIALEKHIEYYEDLRKFIYNFWAKVAGY